jgi:prepilin-type N-terminal cleavage/methylation domain-containing protein
MKQAFTLIELLVVISILGILAALAVPSIKSLGKSNINAAASRQLLDDVGRARQLAMSTHTTVYMVFIPTNFWGNLSPGDLDVATNLLDKQLSGYTFISFGAVGDQPGQHQWHYLDSWQALPPGSFIASQKFAGNEPAPFAISRFNSKPFPFPTGQGTNVSLPYIAFNYLGQLTDDGVNVATNAELIPLSHGSILPAINPTTKALQMNTPQISESPAGNSTNSAFNIVAIDPLTGRATLLFQKVQ